MLVGPPGEGPAGVKAEGEAGSLVVEFEEAVAEEDLREGAEEVVLI